jgi:hypothetical protein
MAPYCSMLHLKVPYDEAYIFSFIWRHVAPGYNLRYSTVFKINLNSNVSKSYEKKTKIGSVFQKENSGTSILIFF